MTDDFSPDQTPESDPPPPFWKQTPKRLKILLPSVSPQDAELSIVFQIEEAGRVGFWGVFEKYLMFCQEQKVTVSITEEAIDHDTGEIARMTLKIVGEKQAVAMEMQRIGPELMKHSLRVA